MNGPPYSLRFLAGRDPGVEFPLEEYDRDVLVGRAGDVDLVLDDARVSRRHARFFVEDGQLVIEDLGSTNGIFVNAQRVQHATLREGDRIQIGSSLMRLVPSRQAEITSADRTVLYMPGDTDSFAVAASKEPVNRFSGLIDEIPLCDLVQLLATSRKSGALEIQSRQGRGVVYLRDGQIVSAAIRPNASLPPRKAVYRILRWQSGSFELRPSEKRAFDVELKEPTEALVLEAMHQMDEIARLGKRLPPQDLCLEVAQPTPSIAALNDGQMELLKLIYVHPGASVGALLDMSPTPDLETYQGLVYLAKNGYLWRSATARRRDPAPEPERP